MKRLALMLILLTTMAGCSGSKSESFLQRANSSGFDDVAGKKDTSNVVNRYLAYEHSIKVDAPENQIAPIFEAAQAACHEDAANLCTILDSHVEAGKNSIAALKIRAKPAAIQKIIALLGKKGEISEQSTTAEDLTGPIEDSARKITMLNQYRTKLEGLLARANTDVDSLIKINKELAEVQSQLETLQGTEAHLMQRVDTEILTIAIQSTRTRSIWHPVSGAFADFGSNFSQGVSTAITFVAYLIPWAILFAFLFWPVRLVWRKLRRPKVQVS